MKKYFCSAKKRPKFCLHKDTNICCAMCDDLSMCSLENAEIKNNVHPCDSCQDEIDGEIVDCEYLI